MAADLNASRLLVRQAAKMLDETPGTTLCTEYAAMAKLFATERCYQVIDQALQLHGGYGYLKDYPVQQWLRDTRVHRILEGTSEIMKLIIGRSLAREA